MRGGEQQQAEQLSSVLQVEFGVVYSCLEDKMFTARRGRGSFCNGQPLQVSAQKGQQVTVFPGPRGVLLLITRCFLLSAIKQSIIATEFGSNRDPEVVDKIFSSLRNILCIPVHG